MAAPINLPVNAPANIDTPSTGRYNLFLNSSDSDQLYKKDSSGVSTAVVIAGSGTVTSVSVVSANGLAGTVANATTTPAITLSTSINSPVLAGNGTALIAATTTGSGSTVVLSTSPTFVTDISAPKIISSTASGGLLLCNNNGVTVASFGVGSAGSTNIALIGATAVTGTISGTSSLTLGTASTTVGSIVLNNATNANTITIQSGVTTSSHTLTLPVANASGVLTNNGSGTLTWAAASSGITVGTTTITSGTSGRLGYNLAGVYQEAANELYFETASPYAHVFAGGRTGVITGLDNTFFGREAGKLITTGVRNTFIGSNVGAASSSSTSSSTLVGFLAGGNNPGIGVVAVGITTGGNNSTGSGVAIGNDAVIGNGVSQTVIGPTASTLGSSNSSTALGYGALASGTYGALALGSNCTASVSSGIAIGYNVRATHAYSIAIGGYGAATSAANQLMIGSSDATLGGTNGISEVCIGNGNAATSAASVTIRATSGSGSNNAGGSLTLAGGKGTGTAAGGNNVEQTSVKGLSGTTLQTLTDRHSIIGKYVDLTESAATTFGTLALTASGTIAGGVIVYTVEANDATDYQSLSGSAPYSVVNKAGTLTYVLGTDVQSSACSSGTLTGTLGLSASGTSLQFQMNAVSSLAQTTLRISFQVLNNMGVATISPA